MKTILIALAMVFTGLNAKAAIEVDECAAPPLRESIAAMVSHATPFTEFDLEGVVTVKFVVDEAGTIHIKGINSGNVFLADHVISTLQNKQIDCSCVEPGVEYVVRLKYVQYS